MLAAQSQQQAIDSSHKVWDSYDWAGALRALRDYLTSMTAKDCSVMVTLQQLQPISSQAATEQLHWQASGQDGGDQSKEDAGAVHGMYATSVAGSVPLAAAAAQLAEERKAGPWPAVVALDDKTAFMYQVLVPLT
jgi:hypothetical protein